MFTDERVVLRRRAKSRPCTCKHSRNFFGWSHIRAATWHPRASSQVDGFRCRRGLGAHRGRRRRCGVVGRQADAAALGAPQRPVIALARPDAAHPPAGARPPGRGQSCCKCRRCADGCSFRAGALLCFWLRWDCCLLKLDAFIPPHTRGIGLCAKTEFEQWRAAQVYKRQAGGGGSHHRKCRLALTAVHVSRRRRRGRRELVHGVRTCRRGWRRRTRAMACRTLRGVLHDRRILLQTQICVGAQPLWRHAIKSCQPVVGCEHAGASRKSRDVLCCFR